MFASVKIGNQEVSLSNIGTAVEYLDISNYLKSTGLVKIEFQFRSIPNKANDLFAMVT